MSNPGRIMALLQAFGMNTFTSNVTATGWGVKLGNMGESLLPDGDRYAELVGALLYLSTTTRLDIAFSEVVLSRFISCPERDHMSAAKDVLRYLRSTTRLGVMYVENKALQEYADAN